mgnify:CR=1 FL=1
MTLSKKQLTLLFLTFWIHISVLDLFYINYRGVVFLWQDNGKIITLLTHGIIALVTVAVFYFLSSIFIKNDKGCSKEQPN